MTYDIPSGDEMQATIIFLSLLLIGVSTQLLNSGTDATTAASNNAADQAVSCKSAKGVKGVCTGREQCEYGPNNIDFTLYAPRGYKRPCSLKEVCCPLEYILVQEEPSTRANENYDE